MRMYLLKVWQFVANSIGGNVLCPNWLRYWVYKAVGIESESKRFGQKIWFYGSKIKIGKGSFINNGVFFHNYSTITLGENVFIGPEVMLSTVSHEIGDSTCRATAMTSQPIAIHDGTWIGTRAIILPGVTVGKGCIIAAGATVTKDCAENGLYAGTPARRIKELS